MTNQQRRAIIALHMDDTDAMNYIKLAQKLDWGNGTALAVLEQLCALDIARELDDDEGVYCLTPYGHSVYGAME